MWWPRWTLERLPKLLYVLPSYAIEISHSSYEFFRSNDVTKKEECIKHKGVKEMFQTILGRVTKMREDMHLLHQSHGVI